MNHPFQRPLECGRARCQVQDSDVRVQLHVPHPRLPKLLYARGAQRGGDRFLGGGHDSLGGVGRGSLGSTTMIVILLSRESVCV